jgi:mRNA interferase HicA
MPYRYRDIERKLRKLGYEVFRQGKGSHVIFGKGIERIVVPNHGGRDISPGVEQKIAKTLGINSEDFRNL